MKRATYESIGKSLGVSKVAVYKALNNKNGVSKELREKIKQCALSAGYRPVNSTYKENLNFVYAIRKDYFLKTAEQFYTSIYYYLTEECKLASCKIEILFMEQGEEFANIENFLKENEEMEISGIFIAGPISRDSLPKFTELTLPIVFIDFYSPLYTYNYVYLDNYNLSFLATTHLIQSGHKKIGFVGNICSTTSICDRFFGYRKALIQNGLTFDPAFHINANIESTGDKLETVLPKEMPTAYVCHCDSAAEILYLLLKIHGYKVPDDVSVLSFDNTELCKKLTPQLSSVGVGKEKYAKKSFDLMLDLINSGSKKNTVLLTPQFHLRGSIKTIEE